jgi:hypothetical protein
MREIRVSPDGDKVAIRSDHPADSSLAWGTLDMTLKGNRPVGGRWASGDDVADWSVLTGDGGS